MPIEERVLPYKLEQHLNEVCNSDAAYTNLLSVWNINKKVCQDALSTVVMNYPHYTKHDISHCEAVITAVEKLLGEDAIRTLSPTDTWLLLHAAYLHDIGIVIECKKIEDNWETETFQEYLHESENSTDEELAESARYINSFRNTLGKKENVRSWPVRVRYAVTLLIADYYRRQHAQDSNLYVKDMGNPFHIDLSFNGLIQSRLINLLSDIVGSHGEASSKILELDPVTDGFNADYAHPRFLAEMLRMGDLLDADNNRFNNVNEMVLGEIPASSKNHWKKHMSVQHILITPDVIEYRADSSDLQVYRENRNFLSTLKEEITFWTLNWKDIMPEGIKGSAPKLGKCELLLNGVPDIQGLSDLRFSISQEKAFEIMEGASIYDDPLIFLRELIQNALDACKVQMWRDLCEERYRGWAEKSLGKPIDKTIQPFEIAEEIFHNYVIEVKVCDCDDKEHLEVIVKDNGTGISAEQVKKICNVGVSYYEDRERKKEIESMPVWLKQTAGFGIGLQSIFLVAEEFKIYSKSEEDMGIEATVVSRRKNGYVEVRRSDKLKNRGTEVHVMVPREMGEKMRSGATTGQYEKNGYDPFSDRNEMIYYKIFDELNRYIQSPYFSVKVFLNEKLKKTFESKQMYEGEKGGLNNRYRIKRGDDYSMELWDCETCTEMELSLQEWYLPCRGAYSFRGIRLDSSLRGKEDQFERSAIIINANFCGLDAKDILTIDRMSIKSEAVEKVNAILDTAKQLYFSEIEQELFIEDKIRDDKEKHDSIIYTYWCAASLERKLELLKKYNDIFREVNVTVSVLKKESDEQFVKKDLHFAKIMENLDQVATVSDMEFYSIYKSMTLQADPNRIKVLLKKKKIPFSIIVLELEFSGLLKTGKYGKIMVISQKQGTFLHLVSYASHSGKIIELVDNETEIHFIKTLLIEEMDYSALEGGSIRRYMPGIQKYAPICTQTKPDSISGEWDPGAGYIISPITVTQWKEYGHLEYDKFENAICSGIEFSNLVDYVYEHPFEEKAYTKEEIEKTYKKLIKRLYDLFKEDKTKTRRRGVKKTEQEKE